MADPTNGALGLTCEAIEHPIEREAAIALTALAVHQLQWVAREDVAALEADPNLEARLEEAAQGFKDSAALLAEVALMDALRCLKAITDHRA